MSRTTRHRSLLLCTLGLLGIVGLLAGAAGPSDTADATCPPCDDFDLCTVDSCDTATGTCRYDLLNCDDGNPCTIDRCNPGPDQGCINQWSPAGTLCDDGNDCTIDEMCDAAGQCVGTLQPAGTACEDGNACTLTDLCSDTGVCLGTPLSAGTSCDDSDLCTSDDTCEVVGVDLIACRGTLKNCGDGNACTVDTCDPATGLCGGGPLDCDDGNQCTVDSCDPATGCVRASASGPCDNGDFCTLNDACSGGNCLPGTPRDCDDGIGCTDDVCLSFAGECFHREDSGLCAEPGQCETVRCDEFSGCVYEDLGPVSCDLGIECTIAWCIRGECVPNIIIDCDDGNPCTADTCDAGLNCIHTPLVDGTSCADFDLCNGSESCQAGACLPGTAVDCDDGSLCTIDSCDPATGCVNVDVTAACDDANPCTADSCDPATGCVNSPVANGLSCADNDLCNGTESCQAGACTPGTALICDDANACTADSCDPASGCVNTNRPDGTPCPDANLCNGSESCQAGACAPGTALDCDDGSVCTIDSCNPPIGCVNVIDPTLEDSDHDTIPDVCDNCPTLPNPGQEDCNQNGVGNVCDDTLPQPLTIAFKTPLGKGSGEVSWGTLCEYDLVGFNIVEIKRGGVRSLMNPLLIPCQECDTGLSSFYSYFIPKHKGGHNIYLEVVFGSGQVQTVGPAVRD